MMFSTAKGRVRGKVRTRLFFPLLIAALSAFYFTGCAGINFADIREGIETRGHYIAGVPFYPQGESTCGPAALASVLAFWGRQVDLQHIIRKVYIPELKGSLPSDLAGYAEESGFRTESRTGSFDSLKEHIRNGIPVICLLDLGFSLYRRPHYVSVIGYDDMNSMIVEHDGLEPDRLVRYEVFRQAWDRAGRWMLVIVPKSGEAEHE